MPTMTAVKERPIIFSAPMVRAILDGLKTQTRRLINLPKWAEPGSLRMEGSVLVANEAGSGGYDEVAAPVQAGDLIWCREAWRTGWKLDKFSAKEIEAQSRDASFLDGPYCPIKYEADGVIGIWGDDDEESFGDWGRYRHARFMPRWASRETLRVLSVRPERVQDITEEDARAEGAAPWEFGYDQRMTSGERGADQPYRGGFACLWDDIHINGPFWLHNPWVWVYEFERTH